MTAQPAGDTSPRNTTAGEFGSCRCDGCRDVPDPVPLTDGLCPMCARDGCPKPARPGRAMFPEPHAVPAGRDADGGGT